MYQNVLLCLISSPISIFLLKRAKLNCIKKRKAQLILEFKEFLYSLIVSLSAGYSLENALKNVINELEMVFPNGSFIIDEIEYITKRISLGESVDTAFKQFSERANINAISLFTSSISIGITQGGNLVEVLKQNSNMIIDELNIQTEIDVITSEKQFELKVLKVFPFLLIAALEYTSYDFMSVLFTSVIGRIGMSIACLIIAIGIFVANSLVGSSI